MSKKKTLKEYQQEEEKLREILVLLEQLFKREEASAKAIIGCLYDIATLNLINKYCPLWGINPTLKYISRFPRPIAQHLGCKLYLQPKCPQLITDWLYSLVEFPESESKPVEVVENLALPAQTQIKSLQGRVRVLTGALVASFAIFIGGFSWIAHNLQVTPAELLSTTETRLNN
ncbi:hypothetical protein IQ215_06360 [Cyanobacterium stanieri LEGE 03274]|uniref:Uncharacterized protein n=1 Tax=Cyanobacterium stanieri LEGE 03274 TaxID=1828756 RepID=A0ABR9V457_9CHRO|nr:hypothetical protein [Cyanobacterium stanieri]MBE9222316.1 hypothetical protein [Cyanobacterium stanieri LEGE 03274]